LKKTTTESLKIKDAQTDLTLHADCRNLDRHNKGQGDKPTMTSTDKINFYLLIPLIIFALIFMTARRAQAQDSRPPQEKINVFAVVSDNIADAFTKAATLLNEEEKLESFPLQGLQIHCTLYMTQYPEGLKDEVLAKVKDLADKISEFEVTTTGLEITDGDWFFMNLDRNRNLQTLSDSVVELLSGMRATSDFIPEWAKKSPSKVEYISKFGSPNVYGEFNPHLTFLPKSDAEKLRSFLSRHAQSEFAGNINGRVVGIGVGIADRNGQISEPWQIFPLKRVDPAQKQD